MVTIETKNQAINPEYLFAAKIARLELKCVEQGVALLWYRNHFNRGCELTPRELSEALSLVHLHHVQRLSRFRDQLRSHPAIVKGKRSDSFAIALRAQDELDQKYIALLSDGNPPANANQDVHSLAAPSIRRVFIGHGRSMVWRDLKDFLQDRLQLPWDEFNRESTAGFTTVERLRQMLGAASFAFLILTAEDEHVDGTFHARENVIHEAGLFHGKLGFTRAIVLLEEGCKEFSNIHGLTEIRFPKGKILSVSEELRRVLEREQIVLRH